VHVSLFNNAWLRTTRSGPAETGVTVSRSEARKTGAKSTIVFSRHSSSVKDDSGLL
jgi:hypothetical protein